MRSAWRRVQLWLWLLAGMVLVVPAIVGFGCYSLFEGVVVRIRDAERALIA